MTRHTDDALAVYDNAVMRSDDALDPDDPPAGRLFIKLRTDRCLTSWQDWLCGSQVTQQPNEKPNHPWAKWTAARSLCLVRQEKEVRLHLSSCRTEQPVSVWQMCGLAAHHSTDLHCEGAID